MRLLQSYPELTRYRDDLTVELVTLLNQAGQFHQALDILMQRSFNPWEGCEGLVSAQYVYEHRALGLEALLTARPSHAMKQFEAARNYPHNLGRANTC